MTSLEYPHKRKTFCYGQAQIRNAMAQDFFSGHAINDEVEFRPMYRQQQEMGIADEPMEGKIVAVRFTEAKVFYDVYNNYWGKVFEGVSSEKVYGLPEPINLPQAEPVSEA